MTYGQTTKTSQDWQLDAYEMQSKHNRFIRHQRNMNEMEHDSLPNCMVNMSKRRYKYHEA